MSKKFLHYNFAQKLSTVLTEDKTNSLYPPIVEGGSPHDGAIWRTRNGMNYRFRRLRLIEDFAKSGMIDGFLLLLKWHTVCCRKQT